MCNYDLPHCQPLAKLAILLRELNYKDLVQSIESDSDNYKILTYSINEDTGRILTN